jgi:hypothetical protein
MEDALHMDFGRPKNEQNTNEVKPTEENMPSQVKTVSEDTKVQTAETPKKKRHLSLFFVW